MRTKHDVAFDLTYYTDHGPRVERCYLNRILGTYLCPGDHFHVVRFKNDMVIADDDTKEGAISLASIVLHQWADLGIRCSAMEDQPALVTC